MALVEALKEDDPEYTKRFSKILSQCLLCGTCSENCPNGVTGDEIIREARSLLVKGKGLSLAKKAIFKYFLDSEHLMGLALKGGASLQHLFLKKIPEESGLRLRFPFPCWTPAGSFLRWRKTPFWPSTPGGFGRKKKPCVLASSWAA